MHKFDYDLIIIGGGAAGLSAATLAHGLGKKVIVIEKNNLGGECTWTGCVPSKTLINVGKIARSITIANQFGISFHERPAINADGVMEYVRSVIQKIYAAETPEVFQKKGIESVHGSASFINDNTIVVNDKKYSARFFLICTGSHPFVPQLEGLDSVPYLTNETFFSLKKIPESLMVLGGGPLGVELAHALHNVGCTVTIIERNDSILSREDQELAQLMQKYLLDQGITIKTGLKASSVVRDGADIKLLCTDKHGTVLEVSAASLLIAIGRRPNIEGLNLERCGVVFTERGIKVDDTLRTTVPSIYACGDVLGSYQFTHVAGYQARLAVQNMFIPFYKQKVDYSNIVWVTFTDPEFAHAGLTEREAVEKFGQKNVSIFRFDYSKLDRAIIEQREFGLAKFICSKNGQLIGAHIIGERAGELIHELQIIKTNKIKFSKALKTLHAYPTYSEIIWRGALEKYLQEIQSNTFIRFITSMRHFFKK
jgi:pyruvate/2-oxoglutarate dehydrogenase complex dihydrolipoamide dehydrogenase (E3) component